MLAILFSMREMRPVLTVDFVRLCRPIRHYKGNHLSVGMAEVQGVPMGLTREAEHLQARLPYLRMRSLKVLLWLVRVTVTLLVVEFAVVKPEAVMTSKI
jgi:hypothetical protein